jgi:hypothetical protein
MTGLIRWLPLLYLVSGLIAVFVGFTDAWRGPDDARAGALVAPSIRDNPLSYRPVYIPPLPGLASGGSSSEGGTGGGWSFGK